MNNGVRLHLRPSPFDTDRYTAKVDYIHACAIGIPLGGVSFTFSQM